MGTSLKVLNSFARKIVLSTLLCLLTISFQNVLAASDEVPVNQKEQLRAGRGNRSARSVKNVILMIPDGCSLATISAARWYQWYQDAGKSSLNIDPYVCGTVRTNSSNAPIGDSAPTTSCYMTGQLSRTGFVATYPPADNVNDIYPVDPKKAYQPLMTVLEASKILYGKSTGLVFTCEFPHATPADCSAHVYSRGDYASIVSQMVHNKVDVVIGGGVSLLKKEQQAFLKDNGYDVQLDDIKGLRTFSGLKLWSLFNKADLPFDLDRDPAITPGLNEMTAKAIESLSKNKKGFFLMVEGSKVDWAAHANDPVGMMTEFLAFDRACKVALDFARKDGNTAVVILPDHGNSGFSIGASRSPGYDRLTKKQLFENVLHFSKTAEGMAAILNNSDLSEAKEIVKKYTRIELNEQQLSTLYACRDYSKSTVDTLLRKKGPNLQYVLAKIMTDSTSFGFTTNGHTGEEVILAAYHPLNDIPFGVMRNYEINDYLCQLMHLENKLPTLSDQYFAKHTQVFQGADYKITVDTGIVHPVMTVLKGKNTLKITDDSNVVNLNGKDIQLNTVVVYVDKNKTFYLPKDLNALLN
jgi:alkaline phosphatase